MSVYENLSEEECYLYSILQDESGLDLAEFSYLDETQDDNVFRAWPVQWFWWRSKEQKQIDRGSRSVGKSLSIKFRAFAFPFVCPGEEMVITAPEGIHLDAVTDNIESLYTNNRLASIGNLPNCRPANNGRVAIQYFVDRRFIEACRVCDFLR